MSVYVLLRYHKIVISLLPLFYTLKRLRNSAYRLQFDRLFCYTGRSNAFSELIRCNFDGAGLGHRRPGDNILFALQNSSQPT